AAAPGRRSRWRPERAVRAARPHAGRDPGAAPAAAQRRQGTPPDDTAAPAHGGAPALPARPSRRARDHRPRLSWPRDCGAHVPSAPVTFHPSRRALGALLRMRVTVERLGFLPKKTLA